MYWHAYTLYCISRSAEVERRKPTFPEGSRRDDRPVLSLERGKRRHMLKIRVGNDPDRLGRLNLQMLLNLVRRIF